MSNYWINVINTTHTVTCMVSLIYGALIIALTIGAIGIYGLGQIKYYIKYIKYNVLLLILLILTFIFTSPIN